MKRLSRRGFLKLSGLGLASLAFPRVDNRDPINDFPQSERLGRAFNKIEIKIKPDITSQTVRVVYDDEVVPWLREVVGYHPYRYRSEQHEKGFPGYCEGVNHQQGAYHSSSRRPQRECLTD